MLLNKPASKALCHFGVSITAAAGMPAWKIDCAVCCSHRSWPLWTELGPSQVLAGRYTLKISWVPQRSGGEFLPPHSISSHQATKGEGCSLSACLLAYCKNQSKSANYATSVHHQFETSWKPPSQDLWSLTFEVQLILCLCLSNVKYTCLQILGTVLVFPLLLHFFAVMRQKLLKQWVKECNIQHLTLLWRGPLTVILSALTTVKVDGMVLWIHYSRVKPASQERKGVLGFLVRFNLIIQKKQITTLGASLKENSSTLDTCMGKA